MKTRTILLNSRPEGKPTDKNFKFIEEEINAPAEGEILLETKYVSVDPYLRGRMNDVKSYVPPFEIDEPFRSGIVAQVVESNNASFKKDDYVTGELAWKELQLSNGKGLHKIDSDKAPLSAYLGVLGMTGLTAYFGIEKIGKLSEGETLVVSGGAGAVGSVAGQIGKLKGCRVVGIAGSDEKVRIMKEEFGFDEGINYNTTSNMKAALKETCPKGIDVYYDNVGGETAEAVMYLINKNARIINCGAISMYNDKKMPQIDAVQPFLVRNSALMQGFIVSNYQEEFGKGMQQLGRWLKEGKLTYKETIVDGFENIPQAFLDLFTGENVGKMIVKV